MRWGPLLRKSYLITEFVDGRKPRAFWQDNAISEERKLEVRQQIMGLLDRLGRHLISHGDMKQSNILLTDNGPVLTDLDAMRVHWSRLAYLFRRGRDVARLKF